MAVADEIHRPVLVGEVVEHLAPAPGETFVDATIGAGGHAARILDSLAPGGRLLGIDRDAEILAAARATLGHRDDLVLAHARFADLDRVLDEAGRRTVDGFLFDLGVSSLQFDAAARGFSFRREAPLDMRMDASEATATAADLVATLGPDALADLFRDYGEERAGRRIAAALVARRAERAIETTTDLAAIVRAALGRTAGRIDPATKVFQALRIAVNRELDEIERALPKAIDRLAPGGRIAVISFHSLEDRIVKGLFRDAARSEGWTLPFRKPIFAAAEEVAANPRARSARLRVLVREGIR